MKPLNEKYSYKDFTQVPLGKRSAAEFNNTRIVGSQFFQDFPETQIFPSNMTGVEFESCALDNVSLPPGNTVDEKCSRRQMRPQYDDQYWIVDNQGKPIEPVNLKMIQDEGGNTDPAKIPKEYYREEDIMPAIWDKTFAKGIIPEKSRFQEIPEIIEQKNIQVMLGPLGLEQKIVIRQRKVRGRAFAYIGEEDGK